MNNIIKVHVTSKAKFNELKKISKNNEIYYKAYITSVPEKGKANKSLINMLAEEFNVPKSNIKIIKGETSSDKYIKIIYN